MQQDHQCPKGHPECLETRELSDESAGAARGHQVFAEACLGAPLGGETDRHHLTNGLVTSTRNFGFYSVRMGLLFSTISQIS
jgi:hypothetical protein